MMTMFLIAAALQAARPAPDMFGLLEGDWACREAQPSGGSLWRSESWRTDGAGQLNGSVGGIQSAASPTGVQAEAELVISRRGRTPRLTYRAAGQRPVYYRLARGAPEEMVFEAVGNGSPRIISYRSVGGRRLEVMYGLANGSSRRWTYRSRDAASAPPRCDGRG